MHPSFKLASRFIPRHPALDGGYNGKTIEASLMEMCGHKIVDTITFDWCTDQGDALHPIDRFAIERLTRKTP